MDVQITNLSDSPVFIPGPNIEIAASGDADGNDVKPWPGVTVSDLDGHPTVKALVLAGTIAVLVAPTATDLALSTQGTLNSSSPERYLVANLPDGYDGRLAYAIDGCKDGESTGSGTGVLVCFSDDEWRRVMDDEIVSD